MDRSISENLLAMSNKRVLVPIADGSEELEAVSIIDTLVRAGAKVTVAKVGGDKKILTGKNLKNFNRISCGKQKYNSWCKCSFIRCVK